MGDRSEYPSILPQVSPSQAINILDDRVRHVGRLNISIADWLQERRRLEEQYSSGLRKLARKQLEDIDLGIFSVPWTTLTGAAETMADSHAALASKIEVDVERPLREFASSNRDMHAMHTIQGNLSLLAKDIDKSQQKTEKLRGRGERAEAGKVANAISEGETAQQEWDSQAPYVFEKLQAVDETRLNLLRDVLTQFQTHEVDLVQKSQTTAEHCLNVLLSLQTEDEIQTFVIKTVQGSSRPERTQRSSIPSPMAPTSASSFRAPPTSLNALAPTTSQPDDMSQRSGSVQEEKKKSRFGGLKRLGTVVGGRKRESKIPSGLESMSESPERKAKSSPFNSFSGRLGRSRPTPTLEPSQETVPRQRPGSPLRLGSEVLEAPPSASRELYDRPVPGDRPQTAQTAPRTNGIYSATNNVPPLTPSIPNGSHQGDLADLEPPKPFQPERQASLPAVETPKDSEGFSVPPSSLNPISQAQADAAAAGDSTSQAFNVNIRNAPIQEEGGDPNAALASVANKLQAPPFAASRVGTVRGRRLGRPVSSIPSGYVPPADQLTPEATPRSSSFPPQASVPETVEESREILPSPTEAPAISALSPGVSSFAPSGGLAGVAGAGTSFSPFASTMSQQSPFRPESRVALGGDQAADTGSIRSGRSLTSTGSQGLKHPELHEQGLNSSIVETVSARFENGQVVSSSLIGEIALVYNPVDVSSPLSSETIRLESFASLDKVAPNPAFIGQTANKEGEYTVNLTSLAKTQVAFKYQLRANDAASQAPLLVAPVFRIEPNQASIIVNYSLNPAFNLHGREHITLSGVMLGLTLEGAKATSCLSKPVGTFSREKNLIWWQLGDITLTAGAAPEKLLARFATGSEASSGSVEVRWEVTSANTQGLGSALTISMQAHSGGAVDGADPFADETANGLMSVWRGVPGVRKLASGAYSAK